MDLGEVLVLALTRDTNEQPDGTGSQEKTMGPGMIYVTTKTDESIKVSTFKVKLLTNIDT